MVTPLVVVRVAQVEVLPVARVDHSKEYDGVKVITTPPAVTRTTSTVVPAMPGFMVKSIFLSLRTTWNILTPLTDTRVAPVKPLPVGPMIDTVEVFTEP